jgi:hypothetical protein
MGEIFDHPGKGSTRRAEGKEGQKEGPGGEILSALEMDELVAGKKAVSHQLTAISHSTTGKRFI